MHVRVDYLYRTSEAMEIINDVFNGCDLFILLIDMNVDPTDQKRSHAFVTKILSECQCARYILLLGTWRFLNE
jgi:hypothetical protein